MKWKNVNDELPSGEKDEWSTICYNNGETYIDTWLNGIKCWSFRNPTHWMPLPEPPDKPKPLL